MLKVSVIGGALLMAMFVLVSGIDLGDPEELCEDGSSLIIVDGFWECVDIADQPHVWTQENIFLNATFINYTTLDVNGTVNASEYCDATGCYTLSELNSSLWNQSGSSLYPADLSKNVGIGTNNPSTIFNVVGDTQNERIQLENSDGVQIVLQSFSSGSPVGGYFGTQSNNDLHLKSNNVVRATLDTNGKLGIGTNTPQELLHVYTSSGSARAEIETASSSQSATIFLTTGSAAWNFGIGNSDIFRVRDNTALVNPFVIEEGALNNNLYINSGGTVSLAGNLDMNNNSIINTGSMTLETLFVNNVGEQSSGQGISFNDFVEFDSTVIMNNDLNMTNNSITDVNRLYASEIYSTRSLSDKVFDLEDSSFNIAGTEVLEWSTGNLAVPDWVGFFFGTGFDWLLYSDGTNGYIETFSGADLYIKGFDHTYIDSNTGGQSVTLAGPQFALDMTDGVSQVIIGDSAGKSITSYDGDVDFQDSGYNSDFYFNHSEGITYIETLEATSITTTNKSVFMDWYTGSCGGGNKNLVYLRRCDDSLNEYNIFETAIPFDMKLNGGATFKVRMTPMSNQVGSTAIRMRVRDSFANDTTFGSGTNIYTTHVLPDNIQSGDTYIFEHPITHQLQAGDTYSMLLYRQGTDAADNMTGDLGVTLSAWVEYESDKI